METTKARLKIRSGRKWEHIAIEIPTDESITRLANRLHAVGQAYYETIREWQVRYSPSRPYSCKTETFDPFNPTIKETRETHSFHPSISEIRYGAWIHPFWQVTLCWKDGDDQPPFRSLQGKNLVPALDTCQPTLFGEDEDISQLPAAPVRPLMEGEAYQVEQTGYERNPEARRQCIEFFGPRCQACSFDFGKVYGSVAAGFIHVHHLIPISERGRAYTVDPISDLIPLCPNCHAVAHIRMPPYGIEEIRALLVGGRTQPPGQ